MPNDTAPAWDGVPPNPEKDGWHWLHHPEDLRPIATPWVAEIAAWSSGAAHSPQGVVDLGYRYLGRCLTPDEVTARERAAAAAAAEAMREAAAKYFRDGAKILRDPPDLGGYGDEQDAYVWDVLAECMMHLPIPADASAALAEVVREAVESLEAALKDALELLDVCWGHDAGANLQYRWGPHPYKHAQKVRDAARAAIRARSEGEGA